MKLYVISDIHGCIDELKDFIEYLKNQEYDNLINLITFCKSIHIRLPQMLLQLQLLL